MSLSSNPKRILSIQSSVVSGYVGNRSATFPLQLLGNDVSCINTVQFSTHTGYPIIRGQKLNESDIMTLFEGLEDNGITKFDGLLTGYVPGIEGIKAIERITSKLFTQESKPLWVLDPVMGDEERGLYVSPDVPALYRDLLASGHAKIITPNQFELQVLAEVEITDLESIQRACQKLHRIGVNNIVVTTFRDPQDPQSIKIIGSSTNEASMFSVSVPYHSRPYQGTGDLFAALLLHYSLAGLRLEVAVLKVLDSMAPVIRLTGQAFEETLTRHHITDWRSEKAKGGSGLAKELCRASELRLIECRDDLLRPLPLFEAIQIKKSGL